MTDVAALRRDLRRHVLRDRLALAIRVGRDQDFAAVLRRALDLGDRLFLAGDRHELGREALLDVDAELLLGQVHDVTDRRAHAVAAAEVLADRLRLGRRLDDDERAAAGGRADPRTYSTTGFPSPRRRPFSSPCPWPSRFAERRLFAPAAVPDVDFTPGARFLVAISSFSVPSDFDRRRRARTNPAPSMRERRSSSAMRPSICTSARSMMCSSSAAFSAPEPLNANKCPHASGAKRPRSWGPNTRKVIAIFARHLTCRGRSADRLRHPARKHEGEDTRCQWHRSSPCESRQFHLRPASGPTISPAATVTYESPRRRGKLRHHSL